MRRAWSRSGERRRGVAELLDAIASALPGSRDPRALRQRFEGALRDLLNAREVELRDGPPMPRPPQNMMSVDVRSGKRMTGPGILGRGVSSGLGVSWGEGVSSGLGVVSAG